MTSIKRFKRLSELLAEIVLISQLLPMVWSSSNVNASKQPERVCMS